MDTFFIVLLVTGLMTVWLLGCWADSRYGLRFVDWFNGKCENPFSQHQAAEAEKVRNKDAYIKTLEERIQVLEKIVTEPAYELNKKINQL
ncbi:hypothetical protein [Aestuariibacter salexigens]|uniref:hypothetical protein n=1 Tax=Aestuariibacter salexigens TaxID=226010 RepID=UPI000419E100|nr:hypothetical protein [Aestuariibacter salexigens]